MQGDRRKDTTGTGHPTPSIERGYCDPIESEQLFGTPPLSPNGSGDLDVGTSSLIRDGVASTANGARVRPISENGDKLFPDGERCAGRITFVIFTSLCARMSSLSRFGHTM